MFEAFLTEIFPAVMQDLKLIGVGWNEENGFYTAEAPKFSDPILWSCVIIFI